MRTKIVLLSTSVLLSAGVVMHHARFCPLQHLMSATTHHSAPKAVPAVDKSAKPEVLALALNK